MKDKRERLNEITIGSKVYIRDFPCYNFIVWREIDVSSIIGLYIVEGKYHHHLNAIDEVKRIDC